MSSEADSSRDVVIRVRDVSKHYLMFERPEDRFKQMVVPRLQRLLGRPPRNYFRDFAALKDISLEIGRGETVGIIGRNGSGKSTLLQIICGTLQPTSGSVEVNGRIAALLELGAGFNPEFTGRENVFLNASILGVPRQEMEWRFDDIARFADIGIFLDQPVKTYSSGMYVRLAFATAINVDPDILVVDEALAVGDEAFQRKCFARIEDIKDKGGTILFVSHGAQTIVQLCTRAILIDAGEKILEGRPKTVVAQYQRLVNLAGEKAAAVRQEIARTDDSRLIEEHRHPLPPDLVQMPDDTDDMDSEALSINIAERDNSWFDPSLVSASNIEYESQGAQIKDIRILSSKDEAVNVLTAGCRYKLCYRINFDADCASIGYGMLIKTPSGLGIGGAGIGTDGAWAMRFQKAGTVYDVTIGFDASMLPGTYFINAGVLGKSGSFSGYLHRIVDAISFRVAEKPGLIATGLVDLGISSDHRPRGLKMNSAERAQSKKLPAGSPEHYSAYVGPPDQYDAMGATQFRLACSLGLREHHNLLDFGCGSLRAGKLFIIYLEKGRYFGIDPNAWLVEHAMKEEVTPALVQKKAPRFSYNDDFNASVFEETFDFIVAQSIFSHAGRAQIARALESFKRSLAPEGLILATFVTTDDRRRDHVGDEWVYPGCVAYHADSIATFARNAGLSVIHVPWRHPRQTWFLFAHEASDLPDKQFVLEHLSGRSFKNEPAA